MFKFIAACILVVLILEILIFNVWLYVATKSTNLANKYWANNFNSKDIQNLSKPQSFLLKAISITRLLVLFLLALHILNLIIK